jgi:hypothetical protein
MVVLQDQEDYRMYPLTDERVRLLRITASADSPSTCKLERIEEHRAQIQRGYGANAYPCSLTEEQ